MTVVPRLVHKLFVRPDEVHPLYGIRYWAHRFIRRTTNVTLFNDMLGDSRSSSATSRRSATT